MFAQWIDEHKDEILEVYIALRRERGDTRPDETIQRLVGGVITLLAQSLRGEADWMETATVAAKKILASGRSSLPSIAEGPYTLYLATRQVLLQDQPEQQLEWLGVLGEYMVLGSQGTTRAIEDNLADQIARTEMLYDISYDLNTAGDADELLQVLAKPALEAGVTQATLTYIDLDEAGEPKWIEIAAAWQREGPLFMPVGTRFHLLEFPLVNLWLSNPNETLLVADVTTDERVDENTRNIMSQIDVRALVIIPLIQAGRWVGLFSFGWAEAHQFSQPETEIYKTLASLASPAVENRRLVGSLEKMVKDRTGELARLLNNIRDSVVSTDLEGTILSWNRASEQIYGWTAEEAIGKNAGLLYKEEDMPILVEKIITPTLENGYQEGEYRALRKDGTEFFERLATSLVLDGEGQPAGMVGIVADITAQKQAKAEQERLQQEVIEAQKRSIQELSTPVIPIMERIIVMPLVGSIDTMRARAITRSLLAGISENRAKVVILDITGVSVVDSGVANHLNKTIQAARLKGAQTIITGISDAVAETIVDLGIDWSGITTLGDLQTGLISALNSMGIKLSKV